MAKITIFGLAGSGKSTAGKQLAVDLGYSYQSTGKMFREMASDLGLTLYEFVALCATDPSYDKQLDTEVAKFGKEHDNFIFESWLAWHFIPDSYKIKFICDFDERARRIAERDKISFEEAKEKTKFREETGIKSYVTTYDITDFAPDNVFDLIIDSTHKPPDEILKEIKKSLESIL